MAQLPGAAFIRGRERIIRVADATAARLSATTSTGGIEDAYSSPGSTTMIGLKGLISADYSPANNNQEFFLLGDEGFRDSVITSQAGDVACTAYFTLGLDANGAVDTTNIQADPGLKLILDSENNPNKEIYVEVLTFMGLQGSSFEYHARGFNAGVVDLTESTPADGLIELSWTFQSRGQIFFGTLTESAKIDVYA
tara:strand:+ start:1230 stop:1817 length:588 start_codon:yes stop_codon:yes gene_type:complete